MKTIVIGLFIVVFAFVVGGCETTAIDDEDYQSGQAGSDASVSGGANASGADVQGLDSGYSGGGNPLDDPQSPLYKRVIYFMYDSAEIKPEYQSVVAAHARYLAANSSIQVTLEGHADERGSREYNIALGEQRAKSIARMLVIQGVRDGQIRTMSYGEEKPASGGHDDRAWQLNRRVEIKYPGY